MQSVIDNFHVPIRQLSGALDQPHLFIMTKVQFIHYQCN